MQGINADGQVVWGGHLTLVGIANETARDVWVYTGAKDQVYHVISPYYEVCLWCLRYVHAHMYICTDTHTHTHTHTHTPEKGW